MSTYSFQDHSFERPSVEWKVSRGMILRRGLRHRCPNCGAPFLFAGPLRMNTECRACGLVFERHDGFFLGALPISYSLTTVVGLAPIAVLWLMGALPDWLAITLAVSLAFLLPLAFYRTSRSWNLMIYYFFLPHELPYNRRPDMPVDDLDISVQ